MTPPLITPVWIYAGAAVEVLAWCALKLAVSETVTFARFENIALGTFSAFAYLLAFALCLRIAAEYGESSWMRFGWLALSGNAAISSLRYLLDNYLPGAIWPAHITVAVSGVIREGALLAEFLCLLTGIVAIWLAFRSLGLGIHLLTRDYALMAVVIVSLGVLIFERDSLSEHQSQSSLAVGLQLGSHIVLGLAAVCSIPLHRLCVQMGSGRMANFMRLIVIYALSRSGAIFVGMIVLGNGGGGILGLAATLAWRSTPWIFALAAVARSGMAAAVKRDAARYELSEVSMR